MRFCQAFMTELFRHIGPDTDVPAGDIGVGSREVGYLFGQYKRLTNRFEGVLTGKALEFGGSHIRAEATGYGCVYMMENMLSHCGESVEGRSCLISGSGNVATHCAEKLLQFGAKVLTLSDSGGVVVAKNGMSLDQVKWVKDLKNKRRGRISEAAEEFGWEYREGEEPWSLEADLAFPCATQNEIDAQEAKLLVKNGIRAIAEGANMPTTPAAVQVFSARKGQGGERRGRRGIRTGNEPEQPAPAVESIRCRRSPAENHPHDPRSVRGTRRTERRPHRLLQGCEYRRIHQGGGCHARLRRDVKGQ